MQMFGYEELHLLRDHPPDEIHYSTLLKGISYEKQ